jgi:hypothetical protein
LQTKKNGLRTSTIGQAFVILFSFFTIATIFKNFNEFFLELPLGVIAAAGVLNVACSPATDVPDVFADAVHPAVDVPAVSPCYC